MLVLLSVCAGCATTRQASQPQPPPTPAVAPTVAASEPPPPAEDKRPALPVRKVRPAPRAVLPAGTQPLPASVTLRRFMAVRTAQMRRRGATMPEDVDRTWRQLFEDLEDISAENVEEGREGELLSTLMRLRMSVDAEFDMDKRRYKTVPDELPGLVRDALAGLDEQVHMLRATANPSGFALAEHQDPAAVVTLRHPVHLVNVTSYFGRRRDPILRTQTRFHAGVDFGGAQGTLVMAAGPGVVAHADWQGGGGNHVIVVHPNGLRSHYSHLSRILVRQGMVVDTGAPLGLMGDTGRATGPHLHFSVSKHGAFVDPLDVMDIPMNRDGPVDPES